MFTSAYREGRSDVTPTMLVRTARSFLWISVISWGVLLGAKIFDLVVLAGAWSATPPASLQLLPYGPHYPVDTGDFFIPSSAALLISCSGALFCTWSRPASFRVWPAISAAMILGVLAFTVMWFWPANRALWHIAIGAPDALRDRPSIVALVQRWITYDRMRVAMGTVGFLSAIKGLSEPLPPIAVTRPASLTVRVLYGIVIAGILVFIAYFVIKGLA